MKANTDDIYNEQQVIGALLIDSQELPILNLTPDDFYHPTNKRIFQAMVSLSKKNAPIDLITVLDELKTLNLLEHGDESYLMTLSMSVPNASNISYYAKLVKRNSIKRQIILKGYQITELAEKLQIEDAKKIAHEIILLNEDTDDKAFSEIFTPEDFERLSKAKRFFSKDLHDLTFHLPFMRGENIYIAGKTSTGKTQLALNLALDFLEDGAKVGYISMELGREQLLIRLINWEVGNDSTRLSDIDIRSKEWWDLGMALIKQDKFKNFYFTEEYNKLNDIVSWIETHKFDAVFIDYIQLIKSDFRESRVQELGEIAKEFRRLSKKRLMVILSQFNRQKDENEEEIDISRLRDSGEIEQTATGIVLVRRDKRELSKFYWAVAKNQTYGSLTYWKPMELLSNGRFREIKNGSDI